MWKSSSFLPPARTQCERYPSTAQHTQPKATGQRGQTDMLRITNTHSAEAHLCKPNLLAPVQRRKHQFCATPSRAPPVLYSRNKHMQGRNVYGSLDLYIVPDFQRRTKRPTQLLSQPRAAVFVPQHTQLHNI